MKPNTQSVELPIEGFRTLIHSTASGIVAEMHKSVSSIDPTFLHGCVGILDDLVSKFEILHKTEKEAADDAR